MYLLLQNVAFQADQRVKSQILSTLGTDQIFRLLSDSKTSVVMKTLGLLRNLISAPHIDHIMSLYGKQIMQVCSPHNYLRRTLSETLNNSLGHGFVIRLRF